MLSVGKVLEIVWRNVIIESSKEGKNKMKEHIIIYHVGGRCKSWLVHTYKGKITNQYEVRRGTIIPEEAEYITLASYREMFNKGELK